MADNEQNIQNVFVNQEPTTKEGFRLRSIEIATQLAERRTNMSGIQFTTDDIIGAARKILFFIENGH